MVQLFFGVPVFVPENQQVIASPPPASLVSRILDPPPAPGADAILINHHFGIHQNASARLDLYPDLDAYNIQHNNAQVLAGNAGMSDADFEAAEYNIDSPPSSPTHQPSGDAASVPVFHVNSGPIRRRKARVDFLKLRNNKAVLRGLKPHRMRLRSQTMRR